MLILNFGTTAIKEGDVTCITNPFGNYFLKHKSYYLFVRNLRYLIYFFLIHGNVYFTRTSGR